MSDSKYFESQAKLASHQYGAYDQRVKDLEQRAVEARRREQDASAEAWKRAMRSLFGQ